MFAARRTFSCRRQTDRWMSRPAAVGAPGSLVLNRYLPVRPLGTGGSGSVWLAREVETDREVALKIVAARGHGRLARRARGGRRRAAPAPALPARARARARRAATSTSSTSTSPAGRCVRRCARASSATPPRSRRPPRCSRASLTRTRTASCTATSSRRTSCSSTAAASSVKLFDFGLALMHEEQSLTAHGDIPGTLAYISPERLRGEAAGPAADVWARRRPPLGGARRLPPVLGRHADRHGQGDRARERRRSASSGPTCRGRSSRASTARCRSRPAAVRPPPSLAGALRQAAGGLERRPVRRTAGKLRLAVARPAAPQPHRSAHPDRARAAGARAADRRRRGSRRGRRNRRAARCRSSRPAGRSGSRPSAALITVLSEPRRARLLPRRARPAARELLARARRRCTRSSPRPCSSRSGARRAPACSSRSAPVSARSERSRCSPSSALAVRWPARRAVCVAGAVLVALRQPEARRGSTSCASRRRAACSSPGVPSARQLAHHPQLLAPPARSPSARPCCRSSGAAARSRRPAYALVVCGLTVVPPPHTPNVAVLAVTAATGLALGLEPYATRPRRPQAAAAGRGDDCHRHGAARGPGRRGPPLDSKRPRARHLSVLRGIEQKIEALVEGVFGRAFRTNVQPVELARKLVKEMDDHRTVSVSRVYVPNEYTIFLSQHDRTQFQPYEDSLKLELQDYLAEHARREGYAMLSPPAVRARRPTPTSGSACSGSRRGWCSEAAEPADAPAPKQASATMVYRPDDRGAAAAGDAAPTARLEREVASLTIDGERHPIDKRVVVLGRSQDCDIQLADPNVSRRHAEVRQEEDVVLDRRPRLDERDGSERPADCARRSSRTATGSRSARPRSSSSAGFHDARLDRGRGGPPPPEGRLPRPALPVHLARRQDGEPRPARRAARRA